MKSVKSRNQCQSLPVRQAGVIKTIGQRVRTSLTIIACLLLPVLSKAQQDLTDSLRAILVNAKEDSVIYETTNQLYDYYEELNRDSAFFYADRCVQISKKNNKKI